MTAEHESFLIRMASEHESFLTRMASELDRIQRFCFAGWCALRLSGPCRTASAATSSSAFQTVYNLFEKEIYSVTPDVFHSIEKELLDLIPDEDDMGHFPNALIDDCICSTYYAFSCLISDDLMNVVWAARRVTDCIDLFYDSIPGDQATHKNFAILTELGLQNSIIKTCAGMPIEAGDQFIRYHLEHIDVQSAIPVEISFWPKNS